MSQQLSTRHLEVQHLLGSGLKCKQIADRLGIAKRTVECHMARVYEYAGVSNQLQFGVWYARKYPQRCGITEVSALQWSPIETAPSGKPILCFWWPHYCQVAEFSFGVWREHWKHSELTAPAMWMPLPQLPVAEASQTLSRLRAGE